MYNGPLAILEAYAGLQVVTDPYDIIIGAPFK